MRPFVSWRTVFVFSPLFTLTHTLTLICTCSYVCAAAICKNFAIVYSHFRVFDRCFFNGAQMQLYLSVLPSLPPSSRLTHVHVLVAALVGTASQHAATEEPATSPGSHFPSKSIQLQISSFDWQKFEILIVLVRRETIRMSANCRFSISIGTGSDCVASTRHSPPPCAGDLGLVEDYGRALIN